MRIRWLGLALLTALVLLASLGAGGTAEAKDKSLWKRTNGERPASPQRAAGAEKFTKRVKKLKKRAVKRIQSAGRLAAVKMDPFDGSSPPPINNHSGGWNPNTDVNPRFPFEMSEPSIAANPTNARNIVVTGHERQGNPGGIECAAYVSWDGGATFERTQYADLAGPVAPADSTRRHSCSDNVVRAGADGTFYWSVIDLTIVNGGVADADLLVGRSEDGGEHWTWNLAVAGGTPRDIGGFADTDKEWIAVQPSASPVGERVYMCYTDFGAGTDPNFFDIALTYSDDGASTWTAPMHVPGSTGFFGIIAITPDSLTLIQAYPQGCQVAFDAAGNLFVIYSYNIESYVFALPSFQFIEGSQRMEYADLSYARFDGTMFTANGVVAVTCFPGTFGTELCGAAGTDSWVEGSGRGWGIRIGTVPAAYVDPTTQALWVTWAQYRKIEARTDQVLGRSFFSRFGKTVVAVADGGSAGTAWLTYGPPPYSPLNDTPPDRDAFLPTVVVGTNSLAHVFFADRRFDPSNLSYDIFEAKCIFLGPCGADGFPNERVSTATSFPYKTRFIGDYNDSTLTASDFVHTVWTDVRKGPGQDDAPAGSQRNTDFFTVGRHQ